MNNYPFKTSPDDTAALGLVVLQSDETIEADFRAMLPDNTHLYVSRVPSALDVSSETLQQMAAHLTGAASLFPAPVTFDAIGYGCTSGTAQIGAGQIASLVQAGAKTRIVTEPVSALIAACAALSVKRLALLSPYVAEVSGVLRRVLDHEGIPTPIFGSFNEAEEAKVVRIDAESIVSAARDLVTKGDVDAVFLSCTNLRTFGLIEELEADIGMPVLSSNQVLGWHMGQCAGVRMTGPGKLFSA